MRSGDVRLAEASLGDSCLAEKIATGSGTDFAPIGPAATTLDKRLELVSKGDGLIGFRFAVFGVEVDDFSFEICCEHCLILFVLLELYFLWTVVLPEGSHSFL